MKVTNYGAIITSLTVPDRAGQMADIVLGYDSLDDYIAATPYFGCIAGRCANRIAKGRFTLDGKTYQLAVNNNGNHLHGGVKGFDKHVWDATVLDVSNGPAIRLKRVSPDNEENYPGELAATAVYTLTENNELKIEITAVTDAPTICNLAQHTYWNLAGHDSGTVNDHVIQFNADRYTPVDHAPIPTGALAPLEGTPFDFRKPKPIGRDLQKAGGDPVGYDHNFVLNGESDAMKLVCRAPNRPSGRVLELHTNQPGCQFYSGNFLDGRTWARAAPCTSSTTASASKHSTTPTRSIIKATGPTSSCGRDKRTAT